MSKREELKELVDSVANAKLASSRLAAMKSLDAEHAALLAERDGLAARVEDLLAVRANDDADYRARCAENERLKAALEEIAGAPFVGTVCARIARAALNP